MARKRYSPEEIIQHLRTVELDQGKGMSLDQAAKKVGVAPQTIIRWRNEYGGLKVDLGWSKNWFGSIMAVLIGDLAKAFLAASLALKLRQKLI